ncbi:Krr1-domain-containing protein [Martensiomyces pterosporus]|nr:Krr1-domain-containing protein [Martensiomyces pterosporus]
MDEHSDIDAGQIDITKLDKRKLLRAEERRRRAGDEYGEIEKYLSDSNAENDSSDESTDESDVEEDEDGELVTPEIDAQIMKTLTALRSKNKSIYDSSVSFFSEGAIKNSQNAWAAKQEAAKDKSGSGMTIRDYQHKVMVEHGGVVDDDEELKKAVPSMTHVEEQEALKNEFKAAVGSDLESDNDEDEGEFLVKKEKTKEEIRKEEGEYRKFLVENMGGDLQAREAFESWELSKSSEAAGSSSQSGKDMSEEQAFLMGYILNRGWLANTDSKASAELEAKTIVDKEEDEKLMELTDNFESRYNFRFEEEGSAQIKSYPREVEGSLRRKDERRKLARERAKERKAELKKAKAEELKQLKNKKKKEILGKLKEIQGITGNTTVGFDNLDLDGDFDPSKFDSQMAKMFGDEYYGQDDMEKPTWGDDIDIGDIVSDQENEGGAGKKKGKKAASKHAQIGDDDFIMDADYLDGSEAYDADKGVADREAFDATKTELKDKVSDYMDKYYQLDFEDIVGGDLPTRFKYSKVKAVNYGLTPAEILLADEKFLNEYVSVKKIAAYRPEWKIEEDLSNYASKKRLIYIKKKATAKRDEWKGDLDKLQGSGGKKRSAKTSSDKPKKAKRAKTEPKDKEEKTGKAKDKSEDKSEDKPKTKNKDKSKDKDAAADKPKAEKVADDSVQKKSQNRRQRQKAKKAAASTD